MGSAVARMNKYAGPCKDCGQRVPAGRGVIEKVDGKWLVAHNDGECGPIEVTPDVEVVPTSEQAECLTLFATGSSMVIEAGAGTGKTATLKLLAKSTDRRGQYLAFNKAIVEEAALKFPKNVACNTAHSLAFRMVGKEYVHRMNGPRQRSEDIARLLGVGPVDIVVGNAGKRRLAEGFLAGHVMTAVRTFCQSADPEPTVRHIPYIDGIDLPDARGDRTYANNNDLARYLLPFVLKAWADLSNKNGFLRFGHDHYLKLWQLSNPRINADFILFDEAQDANPVMAAVVAAQTHAQVVYVGDSQQAIYEFTGAVNTLGRLDSDHRVFLTQSFRFGPAVAEAANVVLNRLKAELRLVGTPTIESTVARLADPKAILCRTNAAAVEEVLTLQGEGRKPHLVGGGSEVVAFAEAAAELMERGYTGYPELACFDSWDTVKRYVEDDAQGGELKLLVNLVEKFGVPTILRALGNMPAESAADVIVSTAHKAKGREWDRVKLGNDFPFEEDKEPSVAEMRLLYVAVTRARLVLDLTAIVGFFGEDEPDDDDNPEAEGVGEWDADEYAKRTAWVDGVEG